METETESIAEALQASFNEAALDTEPEEAEALPENSDQEVVAETVDGEDTPTEENEVAVEAEEASQDQEPTGVPAPEHWSSEHKAQWEQLDETSRALVLSLEGDFKTGYQEKVQGITDIQSALEPWKQTIAQMGVSEADAIRTLFATYNSLRENPLQGVQALAQNFGVLDQINAPHTDDDEYLDPSVKALREQITGLQNQIQHLTQNQQQSALTAGQQMIEDFKSAKDADGNDAHPYFEEALPLITSLVSEGKSLEEAYSQAVWTVPAFREANTPKVTEQTAEEKAAKVKQARRAAKTVKPPKGDTPSEAEKALSLGDELRAAFNEANQ